MFKKIFLDMDGIFADFDGGVRKLFQVDWHPTTWAIPYKEMGTDFKAFWKRLDNPDFWEWLPWTDDGKRIQAIMEPFKPVILTASVLPYGCVGKMRWLKREWPSVLKEKRLLMAAGHDVKCAVAGPNKILIDDKNENIDEWEAAGGFGILYPRPWNRNHDVEFPLEYLMGMLMLQIQLEPMIGTH